MHKKEIYDSLLTQAHALVDPRFGRISNMANLSALLFHTLEQINWAGFYLLDAEVLRLGPFQGKPACTEIALRKGVCGTAAARQETVIVADVHQFAGHIACDSASKSEIVIPLIDHGQVWGVLDIDAPVVNRFDETDKVYLEKIVQLL